MQSNTALENLAQYLATYAGSLQVVGWIIKDNPSSFTTDPLQCAEWHKAKEKVMPVYISHFIDNV